MSRPGLRGPGPDLRRRDVESGSAERYGTLDLVGGGRLILGLGIGSRHAEFDRV